MIVSLLHITGLKQAFGYPVRPDGLLDDCRVAKSSGLFCRAARPERTAACEERTARSGAARSAV
jgi:hypothetical protein